MTDDELLEQYDRNANAIVGLDFWRDEIHRRQVERQTAAIVRMTRAMLGLTAVVAFCTVVITIRT